MAQTYTINGTDYSFPDVDDSDWGQNVTDWAGAVSSFLLQRSGGTFTLGAVVDFGTGYGLKIKDLESKTSNASTDASAFLRMAKGDYISWRNNAEGADLALKKNTSDRLEFATKELINVDAAQTMSSKTLTSPVINTGISGSAIDNNTSLGSSSTVVPTQNAVKSYVDAQVTASDLDFRTDSDTGTPAVDLDSQNFSILGGTGIATTGENQTLTVSGTDATTSAKGVAKFNTANFLVTSGDVTIKDGGIDNDELAGSITAAKLAGSIPDSKLSTISTANKVDLGALDIDGATELGGAIEDTDKLIIDDGGGGDEKSLLASRIPTYVFSGITGDVTIADGGAATLAATQANVTSAANLTTVGALANGSISSGFGAIDNGTDGIKSDVITATTNIELDHQGSDPDAPAGGNDVILYAKTKKVYTRDGAGTVTELGAGGGAGDADTIQLKTAEASEGTGSAPWYTGNNPVPGGGGSIGGTWELSTSNPLINTNDATKVFHYSNGTSNRKGDYFEIELDVPNYAKGHNLVVQLFYRTVGAEDTDFLFFARDRTGDYSTTTTSTGAQTTITLASATGFAVGDRICLQDSSEDRHFRYVTVVDGSDITFSGSAITFASGDAVVSKFFTDELNFITAENNTTNYEGKIRKWAFQINDTTTKIRVGFLYDNSATSTNELFFDQILLSSNQFLQTSSRGQTEDGHWRTHAGYGGTGYTKVPYFSTETKNTFKNLGTVTNNSTVGFSYTALCKQRVSMTFSNNLGAVALSCITLNGSDLTTDPYYISDPSEYVGMHSRANSGAAANSVANVVIEKGDVLRPQSTGGSMDDNDQCYVMIVAEPLVNDVVLLNSQDEIFTDWVDYTPTYAGLGTGITTHYARWRRVGADMEIMIQCTIGTPTADPCYVTIPSGYETLGTRGCAQFTPVGTWMDNSADTYSRYVAMSCTAGYLDRLYITINSGSYNAYDPRNGNQLFGTGVNFGIVARVPGIAGWNSTFNPVLSMPLVDIGADVEQYSVNSWAGAYGERLYNDVSGDVNYNTLDKLGTVTGGSSSAAWQFTATQRIVLDIAASCNRNGGAAAFAIVAGTDTSGWIANQTVDAYGSALDPYRKAIAYSAGSNEMVSITASFVMEAGDICQIAQTGSGSPGSGSHEGGVTLLARRDRSHTNMAHIIKPAVCILKNLLPYNENGGGTYDDAWRVLALNTIEGESWFCSLNDSNDQWTLEPGQYEVEAVQSFYRSNGTQVVIYDASNSKFISLGATNYIHEGDAVGSTLSVFGAFSITTSTAFEFKYRSSYQNTTNGLGASMGEDSSVQSNYTQIKIRKLK